ncbi:LysR family transcriptional regulator [Carnobacterium divergens]|uniref:Transcription regulator n=1 Tax=Carnobacterium divergens DSM 20623 TaxID=1449336 RepID=A0A0R2HN55_CARDV|nr:LysR family transcriptional regulator [Carnobacterium divergens]KRN54321.1 transcription regulator [Carnobacterium divergens DSM 20623]MDO0873808.1 LysR family transcriptional regulator [Carnobacterium divergens]SUX19376.1 Cyn operon transcriptional activator [Carnobacterium divergens]
MKTKSDNIFSSKTLNYFLQLAETMNYTQAAQLLGITQPALTQQIKKLERIAGAPLFYSVGKKLHLSDAGKTMLRTTHEVYDILNAATDEIQQTTSATIGKIRIGLLSSIEDKVFTNFIIDYYHENPDVEVTLLMLSRKEIWGKLENNKIDLAIMYLPDESIKNWKPYKSKKIMEEEILFLHHDEALSKKKKIKMKDTTGNRWVTYPESYYMNEVIKESYKNQLADLPEVAGQYTTPSQLYKFSNATECYTALPNSYVKAHEREAELQAIPFDPAIKFKMAFVYRSDKDQIPRIENFLSSFDAHLIESDYNSRLKSED